MSVGAALGNMSEAWWCPAMSVPGETDAGGQFFRHAVPRPRKARGLIVDSRGERFANEAANYNDFGRSLHGFDPVGYAFPRVPSWLIMDRGRRAERARAAGWPSSRPRLARVCARRCVRWPHRVDVPARALEASVERYNQHAARGVDDDFGRGSYAWDWYSSGQAGRGGATAPAVASRRTTRCRCCLAAWAPRAACASTAGAQVQRADGDGPIEGLFAAGNAAANPFGYAYPGGGATVGPALVFGWLAGETAA